MSIHDRPYFGRRGTGRRNGNDDDDRSSWMARDRFDPLEDGERPRELGPLENSKRGSRGGFAGRGPKGYQRSDERLEEEVCERLTAHPEIDALEIEVLVQSGEVTLQGFAPERAMKRSEEISGVQQVHNRLRVEARQSEQDDRSADRFGSKGSEGQRSSAGRNAH